MYRMDAHIVSRTIIVSAVRHTLGDKLPDALPVQIGMLCARCDKVIGQGDKAAIGKVWHKACFTCTQCLQPFGAAGFFNWNGNPYCPEHYRIVKKQEEK